MPWKSHGSDEWPSSSWQVIVLKLDSSDVRLQSLVSNWFSLTSKVPRKETTFSWRHWLLCQRILTFHPPETTEWPFHGIRGAYMLESIISQMLALTEYVDPKHASFVIAYFLPCPTYINKRQKQGYTTWIIQNIYSYDEVKKGHRLNDRITIA
jgi:hypothetical protein